MSEHFDLVIVGSGAGGATLAQRLGPTGKKILILERGEHLPREADNWNPQAVFIDHKYRTKEQWWDRRGKPFTPNTHYWVGGNTTFYGAALMRLRESDFEETRHAGGVSPAWPIRLADLAPITTRPSGCGGCTASGASIRPRPATSRPTPIRRCATTRVSPGCAPTCRTRAGGRSPCRWASTSTKPIR